MMLQRSLPILFFLVFFFNLSVFAQEPPVQVTKSNEKVLIEGQVYFIHVVKKGETVYSICKAYYVSPKLLSRENPAIIVGLQPGQVLKIPESPADDSFMPGTDEYILHKVEKGETFYSISRQYNISVKEIEEMNPDLDINDIPTGAVIKIPRIDFQPEKQEFPIPDDNFLYYKVEFNETFYSLSKKFGISTRKLKKANQAMRKGLQVGDIIRIPRTSATEMILAVRPDTTRISVEVKDTICESIPPVYYSNSVKVALLLPLYLDENSEREIVDSSRTDQFGNTIKKVTARDENWIYNKSLRFIEFYEGAMLALEDIQKQGMSIDLFVFDTDQDPGKVENLVRSHALDDMDLIIGPVYSMNLAIVCDYLSIRNIPIVSPFVQTDNLVLANPGLFEVNPSNAVENRVLSGIVATDYNKNIVLVHSGDSLEKGQVESFKWILMDSLSQYGPLEEVNLKEVYYSENRARRDTINEIKDALLKNEPNSIVVLSEKETFVSEVLAKISTLSKEYELKVYGFPEWQQFRNIQLDYFHNMDVYICTPYFLDYSRKNVVELLERYRAKFHTEPAPFSFAWIGYDIMYYFLSGIGTHGDDFMKCFPTYKADHLITDFKFRRINVGSGAMNQKLFLLQYTKDFREEEVDFPPRPEIEQIFDIFNQEY